MVPSWFLLLWRCHTVCRLRFKMQSDGETTLRAGSTAGCAQPSVSLLPLAGRKGCCAGGSVVASDGALSPEQASSSSLALGRAGGRRACCREGASVPALPRAAAPKRRGLFPTSATSCCFSITLQEGDPLCHTRVCGHTPCAQDSSPRALALWGPPTSPGCSSTLRVLPGHPSTEPAQPQLRGRWGTNTHPARSHGPSLGAPCQPPAPGRVFSLPSHLFLRVSPLFQQAKATPSLHLPSLSGSQLFFLLFSASLYPRAKNNKEFTALDLERSPAQHSSLVLCQQMADGSSWGFLAAPSGESFPRHSVGMRLRCARCCGLVT